MVALPTQYSDRADSAARIKGRQPPLPERIRRPITALCDFRLSSNRHTPVRRVAAASGPSRMASLKAICAEASRRGAPPEAVEPMTVAANSSAARDIATLLHPYTNLDRHRETGPFVIARGHGCWVEDDSGRRYLEGMAGLWSASLGFSETRLAQAATRQLERLPYTHLFNHRSSDPAIDLAEQLLALAPAGLARVLFANSGSEANDQAVKIIWYYNNALGRPEKKKLIARTRGYHGVTVATASLTGLPGNHADFDLP